MIFQKRELKAVKGNPEPSVAGQHTSLPLTRMETAPAASLTAKQRKNLPCQGSDLVLAVVENYEA